MAVVLVTDGEQRSALAVVRSLGRVGHTMIVTSAAQRSLAGASKYCRAERQTPDPLQDPAAFIRAIEEIAKEFGVRVLLPMSEASLLAVLPERERLDGVLLPFPEQDSFREICDKARVMEVARGLGIGIPSQQRLERPDGLSAVDPNELAFPLVVKPARSVLQLEGSRMKSSVVHVGNRDELRAALSGLPADAYPVLLQERIVGPGVGVFLLIWKGEVLASFFHRRIREKPPSGGVSVLRESTAPDASLRHRSTELLKAFGWEGVAMVEYKVDARSRRPYLMEVNGRFWGSLQLAIDAGIDFPRLLVQAATGDRPPSVHHYREGVRSRWWWGDVDHLIARLRRTPEELALPSGEPGRGRAVWDFIRSSDPRTKNEVFRLTDLRPALRETLDWFRG